MTFVTRDFGMPKALLRRGADPNWKMVGLVTPMTAFEAQLRCVKHDVRKGPVDGCGKRGDTLLMIRIMALLRRYGGSRSSRGAGRRTRAW